MSYELKNFKVLGYTTDFQKCECCGKENLKGTVSILDIDSEVVLHFGTTCAYKADKYDTLDAAKKAKQDVNRKVREYKGMLNSIYGFCWRHFYRITGRRTPEETKAILGEQHINSFIAEAVAWYTNPINGLKRFPKLSL